MKIRALKCLKCDTIVYSRARHDMHSCECGNVFVDGGFDYFRCGAKDILKAVEVEINLGVTKEQLYDDWNENTDKYGIIREINYATKTRKVQSRESKV